MGRSRAFGLMLGLLLAGLLLASLSEQRSRPHVPVRGLLGFGFGRPIDYQSCGFHTGQDWFAPAGSDIYAIEAGEVVYVGPLWMAGAGVGRGDHSIVVDHGGWYSTYSHNRVAFVEPGQPVTRGQVIGEIGSEGFSRGPHLHFEKVEAPFTGDWEQPFAGCSAYVDPGDDWGWF